MPRPVSPLFTPFTVGPLTLANRLVMAPMTRAFSPGGVPGADVAAYYARRARYGVGLIITEGTVIAHPASSMHPAVPHFFGEAALAGWARVLSEVHAAGGKVVPQLWHVGTFHKFGAEPNPEAPPFGPSGLARPGEKVGEPATDAEIADVIALYGQAALSARALGFDGLELHGAHGYLIDQFFWRGTNQRTDRYGGSLAARGRFATEVVTACRAAVGPGFPIVFRFSQWKLQDFEARLAETPDELETLLTPLVAAGVDVFHCSTRRFWQPAFEGSERTLAGWTKTVTGKPVIAVGSVGLNNDFIAGLFERQSGEASGLDRLVQLVDEGEADLVAIGRALLVDPAWPEKIREGRYDELVPFTHEATKTLF
jgi:2,4-dienoyl-CoA reductase-like NADH-dependent reductase (Old Yellow Enzyme family)